MKRTIIAITSAALVAALPLTSTATGIPVVDVSAIAQSIKNGFTEIQQLQKLVREVNISDDLVEYVSNLIRATRPDTSTVAFVKEWVRWGAGPRAGQALILTAKARALLKGRYSVIMEDLHAMAAPV